MEDFHEKVKNVEIWKIKKLIKSFEAARGNGTSMISLIIRPGDQISRVTKMLGDELKTASDIISRVNGQSLLVAIISAQQTLMLYQKVPPNGLVLYTGTVVTNDGKEKKVTIDFEPFKPIKASLYICDNKFHTEALNQLLVSDNKFGFIIMNDDGVLFGTLSGNTTKVLHNSGDQPRKHESGVTSPPHLRMEKQGDHVRKTAELATQFFINPATSQPNVSGLILAGLGGFKTEELSQSDMLDPRLQAKILNVLDLSYRGEYLYGFGQAVRLSSELLADEKFIQEEEKRIQEKEKGLIVKYFEEITQDTGKYVMGIDDTLKALAIGAVETLILWENLDINRYVLKNTSTGEIVIKHLNKDEEADQSSFRDAESSAELEVQEKTDLLGWFAIDCFRFGCTFEFVTDKSEEGSQFCKIGGIGGILRYQLDMRSFELQPDEKALIQKEKCTRMLEEQTDKEAFIQEKEKSLIVKYFEEITQDTGKSVIGIDDTLKALAIGAVETLILWENLDINRFVLKNSSTGEIVIKHLNKDEEADQSSFRDAESSAELEVQEKIALPEWFAINCKRFGCTCEFVTGISEEGSQFCRIGGIGGILRLELRLFDEPSDEEFYIDSNELSDGEAYEDSD